VGTTPTRVGHAYLAQRMRAVRGFARYLHGIDPATEIPPLELLQARRHRPTPHIYTEQEIAALMAAARTLRPPLRAAAIETLIGLLACTRLRVSEAFALDRADIDAANRLLRVRDSKYGKSRDTASRARSSSTKARSPRFTRISGAATSCAPPATRSACSFQAGALGRTTTPCTRRSTGSAERPASPAQRRAAGRGVRW
jgi:integrase